MKKLDNIIAVLESQVKEFGPNWNVEYLTGFRWALQIIKNFKEHSPEYKDENT